MKCLSAGLTFVNFASICGLLIGMLTGGLSTPVAIAALILAAAFAVLAYLRTTDQSPDVGPANQPESATSKYRKLPVWILAAIFAIFAVRSFVWLLYWDGTEMKIQSPVNLGDLGLHVTHINFFANGVHLWPSNPIYVGSEHLRYPAGIDFFNAMLVKANVDLIRGLVWVGLLASVATCYAFYRWGGGFAVAGFLFNGGLVGFEFLRSFKFIDYQDVNKIAWKSIPLTMFVTQRGFLYAIPAGLVLLWHWREKYFRARDRQAGPLPFWVALSLYASMPLFHLHTFMALSIVLVCLFIAGDAEVRRHILTLVLSALIPATFFVWLITDHFHAGSVLEIFPGWAQADPGEFKMPFVRFWLFNFGILVPLALTLVGLLAAQLWKTRGTLKFELVGVIALAVVVFSAWDVWKKGFHFLPLAILFLGIVSLFAAGVYIFLNGYSWKEKLPEEIAFTFAAVLIFIIFFSVKTAPWIWDNLKIGIWAYFIVLPFLWRYLIMQWELPIRAAVCFALFASGFVSLFGGLAAGKDGFGFASRGEMDAVADAVKKMPLEARFASWPTYNHPLLLDGRKVVMGYPGHLWTQGFDYGKTNDQLTNLMQGAPNWRDLARTLSARYVFWGRDEKRNYASSTRPWEKVSALAASGTWGAIYDLETAPVPGQTPVPTTNP